MLQAVMTQPGHIVYQDVPQPTAGPGQIKVKMKRIGVCGSDIHVWHGKHPYTSYPVVQGHEVSAEVVEADPGVDGFAAGDRVTIQPQVVCGKCYPCTHGLYNDCEELRVMGFQTTGMASEYFVVDAQKALPLPADMSWDHGAMIEPLAVAVHAVRRFGDVAGKSVLVLGGGPIGNLVAQAARAMGAERVLLTEPSAFRREVAQACGIDATDPAGAELDGAISRRLGPDRADVIFECVGIEATIGQAVSLARKGSTIVAVGVCAQPIRMDMGLVQDHELTVLGSAMYRVEDYREAIRLVGAGSIQFDPLITDHIPFREYARAYRLIDGAGDRAMKVLIDMD